MAALNYAKEYQQALEQEFPYVLYFGALFATPNNGRYRWVNSNVIEIPTITSPIPSIALCEQIETVYKKRIGKYLAKATMDEMKQIDKALAVSIGLGGNMKMSDYVREWAEAFKEPDPDPIEEKAMQILETAKPVPIQIPERLFDKERIKELEKDLIRAEAERDVFQKLYKEQLAIS